MAVTDSSSSSSTTKTTQALFVTAAPAGPACVVDPLDLYAERYWLPVIGCTALVLARRLARSCANVPDGGTVAMGEAGLAAELALPVERLRITLDRLVAYGLADRSEDGDLLWPRAWPRLNRRMVRRLPLWLRDSHDKLLAAADLT